MRDFIIVFSILLLAQQAQVVFVLLIHTEQRAVECEWKWRAEKRVTYLMQSP